MPTAQELLKKFRNIKTLPHIAIRLTKLLADEKSTMQDFENIIKAVTARFTACGKKSTPFPGH
jgi:hypothetical protein